MKKIFKKIDKEAREIRLDNFFNGYCIIVNSGIETGIFFRPMVRKMMYTTSPEINTLKCKERDNDLVRYILRSKRSILFRLYNRLIGNGWYISKIMKKDNYERINQNEYVEDYQHEDQWLNVLCLPVYFRRRYKRLMCTSLSKDDNVQYIFATSYSDEYMAENTVVKEVTSIKFANGDIGNSTRKYCNELFVNEIGVQERIKILN